ncbi:MAG: SLATT domain-containing protein [Methylococcaceae bacterium]|nr:SLATT domain-containing protein [Methylococcaceae bacterium]
MDTNKQQFDIASDEIARHIEDAKISKVAHFRMADRYAEWERAMQRIGAISFAGIVVFWFVSTQVYALIEAFGGLVSAPWKIATQNALPIGFAIANVISTTFLYLNRFGEKSRLHREAAQRYHRFWRRCLNWQTEYPDASYAVKLVTMVVVYRDELSEINHGSPDIEEWAWKTVDTELAKGGTNYGMGKESG